MAVKSHKLGPGSLTFGETGTPVEWNTRLRTCTVEPEYEEGDPLPVLSGDELTDGDEETYNLTGRILQDYDADSLLVYCHTHANQVVPFTFTPDSDKALSVTGEVKIRRVPIGGEAKERNESDFEFTGVGMYDLVDVTTGDPLTWDGGTEIPDSEPTDPVDWH